VKRVYLFIFLIIASIVTVVLLLPEKTPLSVEMQEQMITFERPKKSAHYESNTPAHGAVLAAVPINVVIDFNFDLAVPSEIKILKDGKDYSTSNTIIDSNKLAMRRDMDPNSPDGLYKVDYKACWPDRSCHTGYFQFVIDRSKAESYLDWRDQKEVTVKMSNIKFAPQNIRISRGTKVTWVNDDPVEHYINADSHPAHTYLLDLNSPVLKTGQTFSFTFNESGIYLYHCSAHADNNMIASLIVE